ncbi:MAG: hypothetical protein PHX83_15210 [Acidobacteriia bacterium]|nr:hypothetical protein [Terriglobia bacterium]
MLICSLRGNRSFVTLALIAVFLLLLPALSTADNFHNCTHSLKNIIWSSPSGASPRLVASLHDVNQSDGCVACLWANADFISLATPIFLIPIARTYAKTYSRPESIPATTVVFSRAERAPPAC